MQEKKKILRNPVRNIFLDPKNKFLKTGIGNLAVNTQDGHIMAGHTVNTQDDPNNGACGYWSTEKANIIR